MLGLGWVGGDVSMSFFGWGNLCRQNLGGILILIHQQLDEHMF